jgi:hypothetical protein
MLIELGLFMPLFLYNRPFNKRIIGEKSSIRRKLTII